MAAIGQAVTRGRDGDGDGARRELLKIWDDIEVTGDPVHRCALAHYLADLYDDPAASLVWDERALAAATDATARAAQDPTDGHIAAAQVNGFYPSLHLNLADDHRRLGAFDTADEHAATARELVSSLSEGPYAEQLRVWIDQIAELIGQRATRPLATEASAATGE